MALEKCRECGEMISTDARGCPKCGAKNKDISKSAVLVVCSPIIIMAIIEVFKWLYQALTVWFH